MYRLIYKDCMWYYFGLYCKKEMLIKKKKKLRKRVYLSEQWGLLVPLILFVIETCLSEISKLLLSVSNNLIS